MPSRKYVYGDNPIWLTCVNVVEELGGKATVKEVDEVLKSRFSHYRDNTRLNLIVTSVNCNRSYWPYNEIARRTNDVNHRNHKYDRLYRDGKVFEIYDPSLHGVFEIYQSTDGKWLTRRAELEFQEEIELASQLTSEKRQKLLSTVSKIPEKILSTTQIFKRNPLVVAEVLSLANGVCQGCNSDAPFKRGDGTPYLEVHHVEWLSKGGEDTVDNAIALCPNCHRQAHYGYLELTKVNKLK